MINKLLSRLGTIRGLVDVGRSQGCAAVSVRKKYPVIVSQDRLARGRSGQFSTKAMRRATADCDRLILERSLPFRGVKRQ